MGDVRHIDRFGGRAVLVLGLILVVVGLVTDGIAVAALGIVALLMGLYARSKAV